MAVFEFSNNRTRATLIGSSAVLMWATLALLTTLTGDVPPFQLTAMAFSIAFTLSVVKWRLSGESITRHLTLPLPVWALGVGGLFGYHFFYFMALRNAPPVEAGLIAYMWPLLIVVFSALLPGEKLRWWHVMGGLAGLVGSVVLVTGDQGGDPGGFKTEYWLGYLMAVVCALTWSFYSILSRHFSHVPSDAVGVFCGATAVLAVISHVAFEATVWPEGSQWLAVLGLGVGPIGAAFFTWDVGVKHGHIQALGAMAYAAPLLSTLLLIAFGQGEASLQVAIACALIVGGAVLASRDMFGKKSS
ncbi:MAG: EamA family transporter [Rhodospirillales bacterium]|nr:EamA family transporter [Rhodospirillales bacterium]